MLNCKEATRLLSEAQERELGVPARLALRLHLAICTGCRNFERQAAFLRDATRRLGGWGTGGSGAGGRDGDGRE